MRRCWMCCHENCGCTGCTCSCHKRSDHKLESLPPPKKEQPLAVFYAVRNHKGQYYRTYTKNSSSGWKDNLEDAKLWTRIGPAKSKITALSHDKGPVPELVEFVVTEVKVIAQVDRVAAAKKKAAEEESKRQVALKDQRLIDARAEFDRAAERLNRLLGE